MAPTQSKHIIMKDSETENLLSLIQKTIGLWKKSSKEYQEQDHDALWDNIAILMKMEKNRIMNKWKNLQRDFRTALLAEPPTPSGSEPVEYNPRFKWWERMQFVRDEAAPKKSKGNLQQALQAKAKGELSDGDDSLNGVDGDGSESYSIREISDGGEMSTSKTNNAAPSSSKVNKSDTEPVEIDDDTHASCDEEWEHYVRSLLPHIRHLDDVNNLLFRGYLTEIIMQNAYDETGLYAKEVMELRETLRGKKD